MATYTRANPLVLTATGDRIQGGIGKLETDLTSAYAHLTTESNRVDTLSAALTGCEPIDVAQATREDVLLTPLAAAALRGHGECRLTKSSSDLKLERVGLGRVLVDDVMVQIPVAGVTKSTSGLSENTTYYIYLQSDGADEYTLSLLPSATGYVQDATTGIMVMSGDATKTLVGMARTVTGPAWAESATQRLVLSYFNPASRTVAATLGDEVEVTATDYEDLLPGDNIEILCWGGETIIAQLAATYEIGSGLTYGYASIGVDGTSILDLVSPTSGGTIGAMVSLSGFALSSLTAGYHYVTIMGKVGAGTATFQPTITNMTGVIIV